MFYIGIVEDNNDPLKLGRLRIRVFGIHTENKNAEADTSQFIPTESLPWAMPAFPISNSSIDGISDFGGIERGTRVFIFYIDQHKQHPVYFAVCPFILDELPDFNTGFADPAGALPTNDYKNESSISRLARNEKIEKTIVQDKNDNKTTWEINNGEITEPESSYNAQYPNNRVIETSGGIIIELDSTANNQRIHIYHPSGSYEEINSQGQRVRKTTGTEYDIVLEDKVLYVGGNLLLKVEGNASIEVGGNTNLKSSNVVVDADICSITATTLQLNSTTTLNIAGDGNLNIGATGIVNITGALVKLN